MYALQLQKAEELRNQAEKTKKKIANLSKSNSVNTSGVLAVEGNKKSGSKVKAGKHSNDKKYKGEKVYKNGKIPKTSKSNRQEKSVDDRHEKRKERKRERSREKTFKNRKTEDKYFEEQEQNDAITSGKAYMSLFSEKVLLDIFIDYRYQLINGTI